MGTRKGREIDAVPLCANCLAEVDIDHLDERSVVQRGLRRMDQSDGGLSRRRWEGGRWGKDGEKSREACGDGADSESWGESAGPEVIYVSMTDPVGRPAFRPSPTKPIPHWMELNTIRANDALGCDGRLNTALPGPTTRVEVKASRADESLGYDGRPSTAFKTSPATPIPKWMEISTVHANESLGWDERQKLVAGHQTGQQLLVRPPGHRTGSNRSSYASTICPTKSTLRARLRASPAHSASSNGSTHSHYETSTKPLVYRGRSYVVDEPLTLPSSLMPPFDTEDNLSTSTYSTYATPPEYPSPTGSPDDFVEGYRGGHYVPPRGLETSKSSYTLTSTRTAGGLAQNGESQPRTRHSITDMHTHIPTNGSARTTSGMTSNECLERYLGGKTPSRTMSHREFATSSRYRETPTRELGMGKLRKNIRAEPTTALTSEGVGTLVGSVETSQGGETGSATGGTRNGGTSSKRRSVHSELRRLFGR